MRIRSCVASFGSMTQSASRGLHREAQVLEHLTGAALLQSHLGDDLGQPDLLGQVEHVVRQLATEADLADLGQDP